MLRGELTRSQYGLAAACPGSTARSRSIPAMSTALLERATTYGDLGRMSDMLADARKVITLTGGHTPRLIISRRCSPPARAITSWRKRLYPHRRRL